MHPARYLRRKQAGGYLNGKYGFGSERSLAKLACVGGGPPFCKAGPMVLYEPSELDEWALSKIGAPQRSTSDIHEPSRPTSDIPTDEARRLVREEAPVQLTGPLRSTSDHGKLRDHAAEPCEAVEQWP